MCHVTGAIPQLRPYAADGATLYALTIYGVRPPVSEAPPKTPAAEGAATLAGPAVDCEGLEGWPEEAAAFARAAFGRPEFRLAGAGDVLVFVTLQEGRVSHCVPIRLAGASGLAARRCPGRPHGARQTPPPFAPGG